MYPNAIEARKLCEKTEANFLEFKENLIKEKLKNIGESIVDKATNFPLPYSGIWKICIAFWNIKVIFMVVELYFKPQYQ